MTWRRRTSDAVKVTSFSQKSTFWGPILRDLGQNKDFLGVKSINRANFYCFCKFQDFWIKFREKIQEKLKNRPFLAKKWHFWPPWQSMTIYGHPKFFDIFVYNFRGTNFVASFIGFALVFAELCSKKYQILRFFDFCQFWPFFTFNRACRK